MIKADHNIIAQVVFYAYIKRLMKKNFAHFYLVNEPPKIDSGNSLIITPNHISWWDGFFIGYLEKKFYDRKVYIMMLEEELKRYWFFSKVGAYSIRHESIRSISETISYTRELISNDSNSVIIYPQGEIEDFDIQPNTLKRGLNKIIKDKDKGVSILPIGFKIQFFNEMKPSIIARFGKPMQSEQINEDYSLYENEFYNNLKLLSEAAKSKEYLTDLFGGKTQ